LLNEIYADGLQEVFGSQQLSSIGAITINPLIVACAKLPLLLRLRRFGMEAATAAIR
jgi:hypothetical protein